MFRITEDPSSGSLVQRLAKNYKNGSVVFVDMDRVGVMAAYCDRLCVCVVHCIWRENLNHSCIGYTYSVQSSVTVCGSIYRTAMKLN